MGQKVLFLILLYEVLFFSTSNRVTFVFELHLNFRFQEICLFDFWRFIHLKSHVNGIINNWTYFLHLLFLLLSQVVMDVNHK